MPSDYVSILRNRELLKSWTEIASPPEMEIDEKKVEMLGEKKEILLASKGLLVKNGKIFSPKLETVLKGFIEELLHLTLSDLEQDKLIIKIANTVQTFQALLERVGRDYENTYRSQFGKYRILIDKVRELAKDKIKDSEDNPSNSQSLVDHYEETRKTLSGGVLTIIQKLKKDVDRVTYELDQFLEQLTAEVLPLLNTSPGRTHELEIIQGTFDFISRQHSTYKEKFESFKSRTTTGIELIKMEINKLTRSQTQFVNDLDELLSSIVFSSLEEVTKQTETIVDQIYIDMRKTLEEIRFELQKISEVTEKESVEGIENLVSSVFDMNVEILQHEAEALQALKESSGSVKETQLSNLRTMENDLTANVKTTSEELQQNIEKLRVAKDLTKDSISDIVQMMLQVERTMLDNYRGNIETLSDLSVQNLTFASNVINKIERLVIEGLTNIEQQHLKALPSNLTDSIFTLAVSKLGDLIEEVRNQFELKPKDVERPSEQIINERLGQIRENIMMNLTQDFVDMKRNTEEQYEKVIGTSFEKIKSEVTDQVNAFRENATTSFQKVQEFQSQFISQTSETLANLDETKLAFEQETLAEIDAGFDQILNALESLHGSLELFWSAKIPRIFENTRRRTENLESLFTDVLDKASSLANKNITKLEQNRENVGLILTGEFSALKETLISSLNQQFSSLNARILRHIEGHREIITRKINSSSEGIYEKLSKELDKPISEFIDLRNQILSSIEKLEELRIKEIDALAFDILSSIGKISTTLKKTLDDEIKEASATTNSNLREISLALDRMKRNLTPLISDVYVNVEVNLYSLLSTTETDLDELKQRSLKLYESLAKVNTVIDNSFGKLLSDLNILQKNLQPSGMINAMSQGSIKLMDKLKEFAIESGLSVVDVTLLEVLGNLVEITGSPPEIDLRRFEEKFKFDFPQNTEPYRVNKEIIENEFEDTDDF